MQFALLSLSYSLRLISYSQFSLSIVVLIPIFIFNNLLGSVKLKKPFHMAQLIFDLLVTSTLLYINGGVKNPMYLVLLIQVFIAPFFLKKVQGVMFIISSLVILFALRYSPYTFAEGISKDYRENLSVVALLFVATVVWFMGIWLMKILKQVSSKIIELEQYGTRIDRYRSLGLLAAGVGHELGTPLNTVQMRVARLLKKSDGKELDELVIINRNIEKCSNALLKLNTTLHDEDDDFYKEKIILKEELHSVVSSFDNENDLKLTLSENLSDDAKVNFPKVLFGRCIVDLLNNALEAGSSSVEIKVTVKKVLNKKCYLIDIIDDGEGMSSEIKSRIGAPFVSSKNRGTGLGLYHLINILTYVGGELNLVPVLKGCTVQLKLPFLSDDNESSNRRR
jgi:two-component system sensor histidine kinase RegB